VVNPHQRRASIMPTVCNLKEMQDQKHTRANNKIGNQECVFVFGNGRSK
jgi:hypothetical protein